MEDNNKPGHISNKNEEKEKKEEIQKRKIKNLISAVILLAGLFIGSLFVDVAQMLRGKGFSQKMLNKTDVFSLDGKTWVAYDDPVINVKVITDDNCEACNPDEVLVWMRRVLPTIAAEKINVDSEVGKNIVVLTKIKTIPAFIFSTEVEKSGFYSQAQQLFVKTDIGHVIKTAELGAPVGKYIELPPVGDDDIQIGKKDSKVKVIEFSDFQCPYCRNLHINTMKKLIEEYQDRVLFVYKNFPLDSHPQAKSAALAAFCANEQGKFLEYSGELFAKQRDWGQTTTNQKFKDYAVQLKLNTAVFNQCLDEKKYLEKIEKEIKESLDFGVTGTPSVFINDQFKSGASSLEELKAIIEKQLAKE